MISANSEYEFAIYNSKKIIFFGKNNRLDAVGSAHSDLVYLRVLWVLVVLLGFSKGQGLHITLINIPIFNYKIGRWSAERLPHFIRVDLTQKNDTAAKLL